MPANTPLPVPKVRKILVIDARGEQIDVDPKNVPIVDEFHSGAERHEWLDQTAVFATEPIEKDSIVCASDPVVIFKARKEIPDVDIGLIIASSSIVFSHLLPDNFLGDVFPWEKTQIAADDWEYIEDRCPAKFVGKDQLKMVMIFFKVERSIYHIDGAINYLLYELGSSFNHSCNPNCKRELIGGSNSMKVTTIRDIAKGEQLTISYTDDRAGLVKILGRKCVCGYCD